MASVVKKMAKRAKMSVAMFWTLAVVMVFSSIGLALRINWSGVPFMITVWVFVDGLNSRIPNGKHRFAGIAVVLVTIAVSIRGITGLYGSERSWTPIVIGLTALIVVAVTFFGYNVLSGCIELDKKDQGRA